MDSGSLAGSVLGHYRVDALIGRGGMGEVYRGHDTTLDRAVALKVLAANVVGNADSLARFIQEARTASALNHPHLVAIYQIGRAVPVRHAAPMAQAGEVQFIAMELVLGQTLRALIDARRVDLKRALDYLIDAADAVAAAHAAGIVHRDLKPDNLMVADAGYVKVLDFGLAKLRADTILAQAADQHTAIGTTPGSILGTVGYMSPEQAEGKSTDHRADVFSFGCVLYEAAAGTRAFEGTSSVDTLHRIIHDDPPALTLRAPSAPPELQRIVRKCLAKDPDARYQSMKELVIDLRGLRREMDTGTAIVTPSAAVPPPAVKRSPAAFAGAAAVAVAALAAWLLWKPATPPAPQQPMNIERLTGSGAVIDATISPDGKYIAYVESGGGEQSLWLRQLTSSQPLQIVPPARVGFWGITFARDSASVAYAVKGAAFSGGQLFQVSLLGGTPRLILSGIDSTVSFSPDGRQFSYLREDFPERGQSAVMIADANGGNSRPLATRRSPLFFAPGFFVAPAWSPDGRRISVGERNSSTRDSGLLTIDVEGGLEKSFPARFSEVSYTNWLPDGSGILMISPVLDRVSALAGGQIWLQPYPDGPPRRLVNDLVDYRNVTISADGGSIVTVGSDLAPTLWMVPSDGNGDARRVPSSRYDGLGGVSWMPDGRLLFTTRQSGSAQIAVMAADGSARQELTTDGTNIWPRATPDGKTVLFVAARGSQRGIFRMNADGSDKRLVTDVPDAVYLDISVDSRTAFFSSTRDGGSSTWRVPVDGGPPALVAPLFDRAALSPDGRFLAGIFHPSVTGTFAIGVIPIEGGKPVHIFKVGPFTAQGGVVQWTADGQGLLYTTAERLNLWLQRLSGGEPVRITNLADQTIFRGSRSPDGKSLLLARGQQSRDAFLLTNFR
jgi:Tol biopolymer transport system component